MPTFQRRIFFLKPHNDNHDLQIVDLLQISRREQESRHLCQEKIREFNVWKKTQGRHNNSRSSFHTRMESLLRRKQVQDAILFYKLVRMDRVRAFNTYMEKLPMKQLLSGGVR